MATNLGTVGPRPDAVDPALDHDPDVTGVDAPSVEDDAELAAMEVVYGDLDMAMKWHLPHEQCADLGRHAEALRSWMEAPEGDERFENGRLLIAQAAVLADETALAVGGRGIGDADLRRELHRRIDADTLIGLAKGDPRDPAAVAAVRALGRRGRYDVPQVRSYLVEIANRFGGERQLSKFAAASRGNDMLPQGAIAFPDLVARLVPLHEAVTTRPDDVSDAEEADYNRLFNRMAAEIAWAMSRRWAERTAVEAEGNCYEPDDLASNLRATAPRLAEALMLHLAAMPPEDIAALMDKTADFPR